MSRARVGELGAKGRGPDRWSWALYLGSLGGPEMGLTRTWAGVCERELFWSGPPGLRVEPQSGQA